MRRSPFKNIRVREMKQRRLSETGTTVLVRLFGLSQLLNKDMIPAQGCRSLKFIFPTLSTYLSN